MYTSLFTLQILKVLLVDFGIDTQDFNNKYASLWLVLLPYFIVLAVCVSRM